MTINQELNINNLASTHPGVSEPISQFYSEAAAVCLDRHHESPIEFIIKDSSIACVSLAWQKPSDRVKRAWANEIDTTENGAYCIALAGVEAVRELVAISRAETHTGADYYLGTKSTDYEDLENAIRLEVSGVDKGGESTINQRLKIKKEQALAGNSNLPAIAAVVGFNARRLILADVALS